MAGFTKRYRSREHDLLVEVTGFEPNPIEIIQVWQPPALRGHALMLYISTTDKRPEVTFGSSANPDKGFIPLLVIYPQDYRTEGFAEVRIKHPSVTSTWTSLEIERRFGTQVLLMDESLLSVKSEDLWLLRTLKKRRAP